MRRSNSLHSALDQPRQEAVLDSFAQIMVLPNLCRKTNPQHFVPLKDPTTHHRDILVRLVRKTTIVLALHFFPLKADTRCDAIRREAKAKPQE